VVNHLVRLSNSVNKSLILAMTAPLLLLAIAAVVHSPAPVGKNLRAAAHVGVTIIAAENIAFDPLKRARGAKEKRAQKAYFRTDGTRELIEFF
jgi:hypothetical protein